MEIPNEERVLARYREVVSAQGCLENHILAKSSLYQRLLKGLQPLAIRPPLNHSYPWYSVVESDTPVPLPFGPTDWTPEWDTRHGVAICQDVWDRLPGGNDTDFSVTFPGWDALGFVWRIWQADEAAETTTAHLVCWHREDITKLTTPDLVEAECRWRAERDASWLSRAGQMSNEDLKAAFIASGQAGKAGCRFTSIVADQQVAHLRFLSNERQAKGESVEFTAEEIEARVAADMLSLLGDTWLVKDGQLFHRGWQIQRITPAVLGPEHYLAGAS
ncbi:hypothetical protein P5706_35695 [Pseudomonas sp. ChxA]|uniref:Uncharacterized protein n=1 Tax=Pseudomonas fluorescens (strain SBW25) TaxID=216595 RepID=A4V7X0_PSEFS|nr:MULTISPECIES: hypothetical protein [Pseudomonas]CEK42608.1 hypothetical protein PQBR44_0085 [Pseudomonas putida UWC1]MBJ2203390.1 hypothetical protein [Pseudomonas carnis]MBX9405492.1 hypothetical protein [Pseudomonas baetica]MDL2189519.1 hypothetical protein [Pseudomonas sp. ChxA]OOW06946.1 hypothetical protein MF6394_01420 [Pseudomonas sp. MF6394]